MHRPAARRYTRRALLGTPTCNGRGDGGGAAQPAALFIEPAAAARWEPSGAGRLRQLRLRRVTGAARPPNRRDQVRVYDLELPLEDDIYARCWSGKGRSTF